MLNTDKDLFVAGGYYLLDLLLVSIDLNKET